MKTLIPILIGLLVVGCGEKIGDVTDCVDCGGLVAPSAVSCPHCGTDFTGSKTKPETKNPEQPEATTKKDEAEGWVSDPSDPHNVIVEKAVRKELKKPTGELTNADLEKVTHLTFSPSLFTQVFLTEVPKGLEKLTHLTELSLHNNKLTDVKGLEKLTQLKWLRLDANKLTDVKGLEKLTQLKDLILVYNQLTDVKGLEKLMKLNSLDLRHNPALTKAQIDELQRALPKCYISSDPTK